MEISIEKSKSFTISNQPIKCKLEIERKMIEQLVSFKYLEVIIIAISV